MKLLARWAAHYWDNRPHELLALAWVVAFGWATYTTIAMWPEMVAVASTYLPSGL